MGSECRAESAPQLIVEAIGTARIARVEIKKNSELVHEVEPQQERVRLQWRDTDFAAARPAYYYVRIVQANGEEAISSPVWVN